ncbi:MAG: 3-dehydroquinate synthase [Bacteroidota bacterium]
MLSYPIHIGADGREKLGEFLRNSDYSQILVLADENTYELCYPKLRDYLPVHEAIHIPAGEKFKTLETCVGVWSKMTQMAMDRKAIMVNLGGGVIGDMGGMIASLYKRGIDFVQVPTTLLSQVDASVGSKLGVDFMQFKNHIGLFNDPQGVYIWPGFLNTLSDRELASGFAEVIKHHLIADQAGWEELKHIRDLRKLDYTQIIEHSIAIKQRIVEEDPFEKGARKSLNFGHTIGHAIESMRLETEAPLLHGEAISIGMICEAFLSREAGLIDTKALVSIIELISNHYPSTNFSAAEFDDIIARALNDKKNEGKKIMCTFIDGIGQFKINQEISDGDIEESLEFYNDMAKGY